MKLNGLASARGWTRCRRKQMRSTFAEAQGGKLAQANADLDNLQAERQTTTGPAGRSAGP